MEHARPPPELQIEGSPAARADAWQKWWKLFEVFLKASGVNKEPKDVQASLLVNLIGAEGYEIFSTFTFTKEQSADDLQCLKKKFDEHFGTKCNVAMFRFKFFTRNQNAGESISQFVTALKVLSQNCEFEHLVDGLIRDRLVCGVSNNVVRDRLLRTDELTLAKAVQICEADEMSKTEGRQIEEANKSSSQVDVLSGQRARGAWRQQRGGVGAGGGAVRSRDDHAGAGTSRLAAAERQAERGQCLRCGSVLCEGRGWCPASVAMCFVCKNRGHFARKCNKKTVGKKVHDINMKCQYSSDESENEDVLYVNVLKTKTGRMDTQWIETLCINGKRVDFKLDCGADLNIISKFDFYRVGCADKNLERYHSKVFSYTKNELPIIGEVLLSAVHKNINYELRFAVVDMNVQNILGREDCVKLGFIKRVQTISYGLQEYLELFKGVGELPGVHRIVIDKSVQPVICPARKVPLGLRDKLRVELSRMEELGIVRKVNHPTEWVNPIVIAAKKNGDIRLCLDARVLNNAIRRAHFSLPTVSEIAAKLRGAQFFSVLDARCGFWMMKLDDASADLCTFSTPFSRYQFLRLPYGINCAPEMFHAKIRQLLEDLEGTDSFIDDIVCWGTSKEEHDRRLRSLLMRAREVGIRFNRDKCKFGVSEITYLGHVFDERGMRPDDKKVKAIIDMPDPEDKKSLERFLGMVNYLSKFIPNYSESVAVLRGLLKKSSEWVWDREHAKVVRELKKKLSTAPVLALYSHSHPITLSVDASSSALGAVLLQEGRPVEFASLTLTDTQCRYAQIEKELLAIVFACERFHQYIFGRTDITVQSDHKPLESIFKKTLASVPARLQRMMLRIQSYDIKVVYTPGKYMYIADTLSRAALPELMHERLNAEVESQACFVIQQVSFSDEKLELVREHTVNDKEAKLLVELIMNGWPRCSYEVAEDIRAYWAYRECLQYVEGVILKENSVFIPRSLRNEILIRIHEGHLGIDKCKRRARGVVFWPGMSRDVERVVQSCSTCALHAPMPPREPMQPHHIPDIPWAKVGSDIFEYRKKYYLILVDYLSNFVEVNELNSITSKSVIRAMKEQFARYGIPSELITDNGPAYGSKEFKLFVGNWEIRHITSSPLYPQSNGKSERAVRTIKTLIKKCVDSGHDYYVSLLNFRSTPRDHLDSPAQILMGRRLNTRLPIHKRLLEEKVDRKKNYEAILVNQNKQKSTYDRSARNLPILHRDEKVVVADGSQRKFMKIVQNAPEPRSYIVQDDVGRKYRRNRRHILRRLGSDSPADERAANIIPTDTTKARAVDTQGSSKTKDLAPFVSDGQSSEILTEKGTREADIKKTKHTLKFTNLSPPTTRSKAKLAGSPRIIKQKDGGWKVNID